jgi:hypothetical protein
MTHEEQSLNGTTGMQAKLRLQIIIKLTMMKKFNNIHPRKILQEEFLIPFGITAYRLFKDIVIPQTRVSEVLKGNRRMRAFPLVLSLGTTFFQRINQR